jgi:hypothetical protein
MDLENGSSEATMKAGVTVLLRIELADNFENQFPGGLRGDEKIIRGHCTRPGATLR